MDKRACRRGIRVAPLALLAAVGFCLLLVVPGAQARIAVGANYRLGSDLTPGRGKDAVGLAVDPRNARHIVEVNADWQTQQCEFQTSFNGGRSWRRGHFRVPTGFNTVVPCAVGHHLAAAVMQSIVFGSGANVYTTFVSAAPLPGGGEAAKSLFVVISRDGGRTFKIARLLALGGASESQGGDYSLPTVAVDPARRGGPHRDRVYVAAAVGVTTPGNAGPASKPTTLENIVSVSSNDSGRSFGHVVNVNPLGSSAIEQSQPVVGRHGAVYLAWREQLPGPTSGSTSTDGYVVLSKSRNHGRTWTGSRAARVQGYTYNGPPMPPFAKPPAAFACCSFPRLAIDSQRNILYLVYGQGPPGVPQTGVAHIADHFINPASGVYFTRSFNGGDSWSFPVKINHRPPLNFQIIQTRHPSVSVAPDGRVDIVWQDRRNWYKACTNTHVICQEARLGDTYYAYSSNRGRTFSANYRISDRSTNNDVGYDYRFGTGWAYGPVSVPLGGNQLLVGWMDSRQGNFQTDTQDVYLSPVTVGVRGAVPVRRISLRRNPVDMSVALSRLAYPAGPEAVLASTFATRPLARVVIVNERDPAGALAAGVLARANLGTVLLSPSSGLTPAVRAEVARLQPVGAYVVGSAGSLSPKVISDLAGAGVPANQIVRLAGANTADTARQIAQAVDHRTAASTTARIPAFDAAIIANPSSRTAVAAAALAADRRLPILYVSRNSLPAETTAALSQLNITHTLVIGGRGAVSNAVMGHLPSPQRIGGSDLYATSRALVGPSIRRGVPSNLVYVTDGRNAMETALLGAPLGRIGALELVARGGQAGAARTVTRVAGGTVTQLVMVTAK